MTNENLKQALSRLHIALAANQVVDPELLVLLKSLDADIQAKIQAHPASEESSADLTTRAQELSAKFSATHPQLESILREFADTLQRIGI